MITPYNRLEPVGNDINNIRQAIENGHLFGNGIFTKRCQRWLQERIGCEMDAILTLAEEHGLFVIYKLLTKLVIAWYVCPYGLGCLKRKSTRLLLLLLKLWKESFKGMVLW